MTQTYRAWDENDYPWPPPQGWYQASDGAWWPEGYGPGVAVVAMPTADGSPTGVVPSGQIPDHTIAVAPIFQEASNPVTGGFGAPPFGSDPHGPPPAGPPTMGSPVTTTVPPVGFGGDAPVSATVGGNGGSSGSKTLLFVLGGALGLIIVAGIGFLALGQGGDDEAITVSSTTTPESVAESAGAETSGESAGAETSGESDASTSTSVAGNDAPGSFQTPHAITDIVTVFYEDATGEERRWSVEVLEPARDATQEVLAENQFNDPPVDGEIFVTARVMFTLESGPNPTSLSELNLKAVGDSNVVLTWFENQCGVVPDDLDKSASLFPGGSVEGNICWATKASDLGTMKMLIDTFLADGAVYISLEP